MAATLAFFSATRLAMRTLRDGYKHFKEIKKEKTDSYSAFCSLWCSSLRRFSEFK
jgi:hypothetical protein